MLLSVPCVVSFNMITDHRSSAAVSTNSYFHFEKHLATADSDIERKNPNYHTYNTLLGRLGRSCVVEHVVAICYSRDLLLSTTLCTVLPLSMGTAMHW